MIITDIVWPSVSIILHSQLPLLSVCVSMRISQRNRWPLTNVSVHKRIRSINSLTSVLAKRREPIDLVLKQIFQSLVTVL
jgi:hypothetical protein